MAVNAGHAPVFGGRRDTRRPLRFGSLNSSHEDVFSPESREHLILQNWWHLDVPHAENAQAFDAASVALPCCARLHPGGGGMPRLELQRGRLAQR